MKKRRKKPHALGLDGTRWLGPERGQKAINMGRAIRERGGKIRDNG
jgi:hypothetical protein